MHHTASLLSRLRLQLVSKPITLWTATPGPGLGFWVSALWAWGGGGLLEIVKHGWWVCRVAGFKGVGVRKFQCMLNALI